MDSAYQAWHCGNEDGDCFGAELEHRDDSTITCPECGRVYDADDGRRLPEEE